MDEKRKQKILDDHNQRNADLREAAGSDMGKWFKTFKQDEDWMMRDERTDYTKEMLEQAVRLGFVKVHKLPKGCTGWNAHQLLPKGRLWLRKQM